MELYKYTEKCWADGLLKRGQIRLTDLSYYRDTANLGRAIGDDRENFRVVHSFDNEIKTSISQLNPVERKFITVPEGFDGPFEFSFNRIDMNQRGPRVFAFCISNVWSKEIQDRFNQEFEELNKVQRYDACVRISSSMAFIKAMKKHLKLHYNFDYKGFVQCAYIGRSIVWTESHLITPYQHKDPEHAWQSEFRIMFAPPFDFVGSHLDATIPELVKYLDIRDF